MQTRVRIVQFVQCLVGALALLHPNALREAIPKPQNLTLRCQLLEVIRRDRRVEMQVTRTRVVVLKPPKQQRFNPINANRKELCALFQGPPLVVDVYLADRD